MSDQAFMKVSVMIEGQEDVGWDDWCRIASVCEDYGYDALFRSDHYAPVEGLQTRGSLDAWSTICALAGTTKSLRLGTLVSPITFRHPSLLAKSVVTADHVSGGRIELGLGAGWSEPDHILYGFPFPPLRERMEMLAEQLQILHGQWGAHPFAFQGAHYRLAEHDARPKPVQTPHPPLIIGGRARRVSTQLAAYWADEYNTFDATLSELPARHDAVAHACERIGRDPSSIHFSFLAGWLVGADQREVLERARRLLEWRGISSTPEDYLARVRERWLAGTVEEVIERLRELVAVGVDRVMIQHYVHRDLESLKLIGQAIIPAVA